MTVLPCWQHLPEAEWRARALKLQKEIDGENCDQPEEDGDATWRARQVQAILDKNPRDRIPLQTHTPTPLVLAATKKVREALEDELRAVFGAYREASQRFRAGEWDVTFPSGTFRPGGGFVFFG